MLRPCFVSIPLAAGSSRICACLHLGRYGQCDARQPDSIPARSRRQPVKRDSAHALTACSVQYGALATDGGIDVSTPCVISLGKRTSAHVDRHVCSSGACSSVPRCRPFLIAHGDILGIALPTGDCRTGSAVAGSPIRAPGTPAGQPGGSPRHLRPFRLGCDIDRLRRCDHVTHVPGDPHDSRPRFPSVVGTGDSSAVLNDV
ncbi:hypothetical protein D3C81_1489390 [compost metagenome]